MASKKESGLSASSKKDYEKQGFKFRDRSGKLTKWEPDMTVEGVFLGFKDGKTFGRGSQSRVSKLVRIKTGEGVQVFPCPAVLESALEDVDLGSEVAIFCLGQTLQIEGRNQPAWDFEVATRAAIDIE